MIKRIIRAVRMWKQRDRWIPIGSVGTGCHLFMNYHGERSAQFLNKKVLTEENILGIRIWLDGGDLPEGTIR